MKTYKQFTQDLEENVLTKTYDSIKDTASKVTSRIPKPIKRNLGRFASGLFRLDNLDNAIRNPNKDDLLTRATSAIGVVKPFSGPAFFGPEIINQAKPNSILNKAANYIDKKATKITVGRLSRNPDTDLGNRISKFANKKLDQILQRRNQNMGASDLKNTSSGMG